MSNEINLSAILEQRLKEFQSPQEAADHFKVSTNAVAKFQSSRNFPTVGWQILVNELVREQRLWLLDKAGPPPQQQRQAAPAAEPEKAPVAGEAALATMGTSVEGRAIDFARVVGERAAELPRTEAVDLMGALIRAIKPQVEIIVAGTNTRDLPFAIFTSLMGNTMNFRTARTSLGQEDTVEESLNLLVQNFLRGETPWAVFLSPELITPFGNPEWMRATTHFPWGAEFAGVKTVERLTESTARKIVGGLHAHRTGKLAIAQNFGEDTPDMKEAVALVTHSGPVNKLVEVPWISRGLMAVHREVFTDILKGSDELKAQLPKGTPFPFFAPQAGPMGSDKRFCSLARKAGHRVFLDLGIMAARAHRGVVFPASS